MICAQHKINVSVLALINTYKKKPAILIFKGKFNMVLNYFALNLI